MAVKKTTATKTKSISKISIQDVEEFLKDKKQCNNCGRILKITTNFYISHSKVNKYNQRMSLCKDCLNSLVVEYTTDLEDIKIGIYKTCTKCRYIFCGRMYLTNHIVQLGIAQT